MAVDTLEVVLLTTGSRNGKAKLEPDAEPAKGQDATDDPKKQTDADGARGGENTRRR